MDVSAFRRTYRNKVCQYNQKGELLHIFNSAAEAARKLGIQSSTVVKAMVNGHKVAGFYIIPYGEDIDKVISAVNSYVTRSKTPVCKYDGVSGNFIKEYESIADVKKEHQKANTGSIIRAIKNRRKSLGYY